MSNSQPLATCLVQITRNEEDKENQIRERPGHIVWITVRHDWATGKPKPKRRDQKTAGWERRNEVDVV